MTKKAFRAESGLDAGAHNVINVADPRVNELLDGVNVNYFIENNTVQPFDATRDYEQFFAVTYENRLWISKVHITKGNFDYTEWESIRVDPSWEVVTGTAAAPQGKKLQSGDYISAYSVNSELDFYLPAAPAIGDTIVIKDEGMYCNLNYIKVHAPAKPFEDATQEDMFSIPGSMKTYIYSSAAGGRWVIHTSVDKIESKIISRTQKPTQAASGDQLYRKSSTGHIIIQLPKYARNGDVVSTYDLDGLSPVNGTTIQTHPDSGYFIDSPNTTSIKTNTKGNGIFVFRDGLWSIWDGDIRSRWKKVNSNTQAFPFDHLSIVGKPNDGHIVITLPVDAQGGDYVRLSNTYAIAGLSISVKVTDGSGHMIVGNVNTFAYPKFSSLSEDLETNPTVESIDFTGLNYGAVVEFYFNNADRLWVAADTHLRTEHVDESNRDRPGVAPLASQSEVDKNHEQSPRDDMIVTPKTLANSTANETRRGIARIATAKELQVVTTGVHLNDVIVTPKRLNERQSTEEIRGVAEIATIAETKVDTNDTHIITPKKLNSRRASNSLSGVVRISNINGVPAVNRTVAGTGQYDWSDAIHDEPFVLTPKALNETQATETSKGVGYVATQSETNTQGSTASDSVFITPKKLDSRRSTDVMAGIAEIATQQETNTGTDYTRIVTPKTLNDRRSTETLHGLAEIATQDEVNDGKIDTHIITPLKFANWMTYEHFATDISTGIEHTGHIWDGVSFKIRPATETQVGTLRVATQSEANGQGAAAIDTRYITPKKLDARRATETMAGIAEIATSTEVNSEVDAVRMITPKGLSQYIHSANSATMTESVNGTGITSSLVDAFAGNDTVGSIKPSYMDYDHNPKVVSPRALNFALRNFLPLKAKAVDSDKLDGLDSLQFLRSDESDVMYGNLVVNGDVSTNIVGYGARLTSSSETVYVQGGKVDGDVTNQKMVISGYLAKPLTSFDIMMKEHGVATIKGQKIYTAGAKPTPSEIGAYTKKESDDKFVDVAGDMMVGALTLPELKFSLGAKKFSINCGDSGLAINVDGSSKLTLDPSGNLITGSSTSSTSFRVGNTTVIETDAKINWNKLKSIPAATTSVAGIVQLNNTLDNNSQTQAATANTIKILKEMIDEKAGITGAIMNDLKIKNWIRIGNVILRPNPANKTLDFIWTEDPM